MGTFSKLFCESKKNDLFKITGKNYTYKYMGYGQFCFKSSTNDSELITGVEDVILIVQNTNISTFFQLIDTLSNFKDDKTSLYVLYQVSNLRKAALFDELHALLDMGKIGLECFEENNQNNQFSNIPLDCIQDYIIKSRKQLFLISGSKNFYGNLKS